MADRRVGATRFGGVPDLAPASAWPRGPYGPIDFIGQLDLAELALRDVDGLLPREGMLAFFCGWNQDGWDHAVIHTIGELEPCEVPDDLHLARIAGIDVFADGALPPPWSRFVAPTTRAPMYNAETGQNDLTFEPVVELAPAAHERYFEIYERWYAEVDDGQGMFGYDRLWECEQRPDEIMLLRLDPGCGTDVDFIEAATLYFLIPRDALVAGDFTRVRAHFGADI